MRLPPNACEILTDGMFPRRRVYFTTVRVCEVCARLVGGMCGKNVCVCIVDEIVIKYDIGATKNIFEGF